MVNVHVAVGVAVIAVCLGAAVLGFVSYRRGSGAGGLVAHSLALAQTVLIGQAAVGLLLLSDGRRPRLGLSHPRIDGNYRSTI